MMGLGRTGVADGKSCLEMMRCMFAELCDMIESILDNE